MLDYNERTIKRLRLVRPDLKTGKGAHYADLLERYGERANHRLGQSQGDKSEAELIPPEPVDKSMLLLGAPKRLRDPGHLKFINTQPCLACGRVPAHAHHLRFAQPRSMSNKVSDEWTVPLCFTHHRALHTVGNEEAWWAEKGIDAMAEALRLWRQSHGIGAPTELDQTTTEPASPKPTAAVKDVSASGYPRTHSVIMPDNGDADAGASETNAAAE
jgi:hypothetical protein